MHCCAQWRNFCNGCPAKLLIYKYKYLPCHSHNDGVPISNQGVATIFSMTWRIFLFPDNPQCREIAGSSSVRA